VPRLDAQTRKSRPGRDAGLSVAFWGVRGSAPVCGADHLVFGGSTMCLEVTSGHRRVIIDAGTGIQRLGRALPNSAARSTDILLSHFHMDHVMGLMTFAPMFRRGATVTVHAPLLGDGDPAEILGRLCDAPFFPLNTAEAGATFVVKSFRPGAGVALPGFDISTIGLSHPGGACGYRIASGGRDIAVIVDHEHGAGQTDDRVAAFCREADLILYDSHWDARSDYAPHRGWGHSTWQAGLDLLRGSGAKRLGCIHHAPGATDMILQEREAALQREHPLGFFAREGSTLSL
jgi:phosphoribosyl 1,2-cyclic phosphodiesterase